MQSFFSFIKDFKIPKKTELKSAFNKMTPKQLALFFVSSLLALSMFVAILAKINNYYMVSVPKTGGNISEGIIGIPTFVNPILAISSADKDMTTLVYSGLMRKMPDGTIVPDLAKSYEVSNDGLTYTFILKDNLSFHDKKPVTAEDIIFTIEKIKDPLIKSPKKAQWDSIEVSKIDDKTIVFNLRQPYASFLGNNATLGILPNHIWKNINSSEFPLSGFNIKAIGTGPYMIDSISKSKEGTPETYSLSRFKKFALGTPNIKTINITSYSNEKDLVDALLSTDIDQAGGISPENTDKVIKDGYTVHTSTLPRMFGLFFNQSRNNLFADKTVIGAIEKALDKQSIVDTVLYGHGTPIDHPIPATILSSEDASNTYSLDEANKMLDNAGWVKDTDGYRSKGGTTKTVTTTTKVKGKTVKKTGTVSTGPKVYLSFSIITGDDTELDRAANIIASQLKEIGIRVEVKNYDMGALNNLIRAREYESLFFGQVVNNESDLYAFWHSSQRTDPGLNIAMYANPTIDTLLEKSSKTLKEEEKNNLYKIFTKEFKKDKPALFIYSPQYIYATKKDVTNVVLPALTTSSNRFVSIYTWYAQVDHVWKIFAKN
jgi:peptide/nickel transport system substrate-binding protein